MARHSFKTEKEKMTGKNIKFVAVLIAVLIVGGSLGVVYAAKNDADFDFFGIFGDEQTEKPSETTPEATGLERDVLLYCASSDKTSLRFLTLCKVRFPTGEFTFMSIDPSMIVTVGGRTASIEKFYSSLGYNGLLDCVEYYTGIRPDHYIGATESAFKAAIGHFSGLYLDVDENINYKCDEFVLTLIRGANRKFSGVDLLRYFRYLLTLGHEGLVKQSDLLCGVFGYYLTEKNVSSAAKHFASLVDLFETDIDVTLFSPLIPTFEAMTKSGYTFRSAGSLEEYDSMEVMVYQ